MTRKLAKSEAAPKAHVGDQPLIAGQVDQDEPSRWVQDSANSPLSRPLGGNSEDIGRAKAGSKAKQRQSVVISNGETTAEIK